MPIILGAEKSLDQVKAAALTVIDEASSLARSKYLTTMRAKQNAYDSKYNVAMSILSSTVATLSADPMLKAIDAEAAARGITRTQMAQKIKDRRTSCSAIVASIETIAMPAKVNVNSATTIPDVARIKSEAVKALNNV